MKIYNVAFWIMFSFTFACNDAMEFSPSFAMANSQSIQKNNAEASNLVFKSTNGGQTWQDISKGLPENMQGGGFFADESGFYLHSNNQIYHTKPNSTGDLWKKEIFFFSEMYNNIGHSKTGMFAYSNNGYFLQKINGTNVWLPKYTNFQGKQVNNIFESAGDAVFISTPTGIFKSTNNGHTWKHVYTEGWVIKLVESDSILLATSQAGILRSTNNGENWTPVLSEGGVGIDVEGIKGGFAAINFNTQSNTRRVRTSYDGGKTWQPIDAGFPTTQSFNFFTQTADKNLPEQAFITSIIQVGDYFLCGHPKGILRSLDKGKTWKILLPSIGNKVFNLFVSGNVIFAIPRNAGC